MQIGSAWKATKKQTCREYQNRVSPQPRVPEGGNDPSHCVIHCWRHAWKTESSARTAKEFKQAVMTNQSDWNAVYVKRSNLSSCQWTYKCCHILKFVFIPTVSVIITVILIFMQIQKSWGHWIFFQICFQTTICASHVSYPHKVAFSS